MIFIILIWVIVIIAILSYGEWEHIGNGIAATFTLVFVLGIISLVDHNKEKSYIEVRKEILSLDDGKNISGSFFLGSGNIRGNQVFRFYYKTPDGGYKRDHESASRTTIYEDENNNPYVLYNKYKYMAVSEKWDFWLVLFTYNDDPKKDDRPYNRIESVEFHVPENTIIKEIELDNKN